MDDTKMEDSHIQDIVDMLGNWVEAGRSDLALACVEVALKLPSDYWNSVNYAASSKFSFASAPNLTVQSILKLADSQVTIGDVHGAIMEFVLSVARGGFSLRLLTAMLDGESFSRLMVGLERDEVDLTVKILQVVEECFVPDLTPLSEKLCKKVLMLLQLSESMEVRSLCCDICLKFNLDLEPMKRLIDSSNPELHSCALQSILKKTMILSERSDLQEVLLNFAPRMNSPNLIMVFKILKGESRLGVKTRAVCEERSDQALRIPRRLALLVANIVLTS